MHSTIVLHRVLLQVWKTISGLFCTQNKCPMALSSGRDIGSSVSSNADMSFISITDSVILRGVIMEHECVSKNDISLWSCGPINHMHNLTVSPSDIETYFIDWTIYIFVKTHNSFDEFLSKLVQCCGLNAMYFNLTRFHHAVRGQCKLLFVPIVWLLPHLGELPGCSTHLNHIWIQDTVLLLYVTLTLSSTFMQMS